VDAEGCRPQAKLAETISKTKYKRAGDISQVVEGLPRMFPVLKKGGNQAWEYMPVIPDIQRQR
jgi:hypothetical protein